MKGFELTTYTELLKKRDKLNVEINKAFVEVTKAKNLEELKAAHEKHSKLLEQYLGLVDIIFKNKKAPR